MSIKHLFVAIPAALFILGSGTANAGETINEVGTLACVNDKWDEKEVDKGHKLVNFAGRCMKLPSDPSAVKVPMDCVGNYEYMPDGSWKGAGTCTRIYKDGGKMTDAWEVAKSNTQPSVSYVARIIEIDSDVELRQNPPVQTTDLRYHQVVSS